MRIYHPHQRILPVLILLLLPSLANIGRPATTEELGRSRAFLLRFTVSVRNPGQTARDIRIDLPVLDEGELPPYEKGILSSSDLQGAHLSLNGQGGAAFTLDELKAGSRVSFSLTYRIEVQEVTFHLPFLSRISWPDLPASTLEYLEPSEGIESDNSEITALASQVAGDNRDPVFIAKALYAFTNKKLDYDAAAGKTSALESLELGKASCEGYARLYAALCRAAGIPARLVYGLRLESGDLRGNEFMADETRHMWNEIYLAGIGWTPVDPTFSYVVNDKREVTYSYFARLTLDDLHLIISYNEQKVTWTYRVPPDHPGLDIEHHIYLTPING